jgi:5-hydroxyisourate hydrolase
MSPITTHVLDTSRGRTAAGVAVMLELRDSSGQWRELGRGATDADGRCRTLLTDSPALAAGVYRLTFETGAYFAASKVEGFYPSVPVVFEVRDVTQHYHVPLLISPFGFSTYRGS